ncbi:MAG: LptF/LptG family permease [Planctomycetota bacterium]|nr:LptF/LptG family permease [Planctomycetaceae bacterium]MDQ3333165.1 LptF/LptG family permease [Planctomycetota bacterium]
MTTFDRYLLSRFLYTFVILFITFFGLYVVIDGFTNVDEFQNGTDEVLVVLKRMGAYYAYQSSLLLNLMGPTVAVSSVMVVAALLVKNSEYQPVLAAGVPLARLALPFVVGLLLVTGAVVANQEFVIPKIGHKLQGPRSDKVAVFSEITPQHDYSTGVMISRGSLDTKHERVVNAEFLLPVPDLVSALTTVYAESARYVRKTSTNPAGWVLTETTPAHYREIPLTKLGTRFVRPVAGTDEVFIQSDISFDLVVDNSRSATWQATPEIVRRIRNPALSRNVAREQTFLLHGRLVQPLLNLFAGLACIPLVIRRESRSLVGSIAMACGVQGVLLGALHGSAALGKAGFVPADVASWIPVILCGTLAAWSTGYAQT